MDDRIIVIVLTVVALLVLEAIILLAAAGWDTGKLGLAWRILRRSVNDDAFADRLRTLMEPAPAQPSRPSGVPLRVLALLQREGRLVDFLMEDVQGYQDAQIGAAVRDIHRQCQAALKEHLVIEPVLPKPEGSTVDVPVGFDPSAVRLVGNVTGEPPFRGTLQHHGWRVKEIKLTPPPEGQDELVLSPAEVELP